METNRDYHRRRASEHRAQADRADASSRIVHHKLAELHDQRAQDGDDDRRAPAHAGDR